eukprot:654546-Amphidinium_carterae.1
MVGIKTDGERINMVICKGCANDELETILEDNKEDVCRHACTHAHTHTHTHGNDPAAPRKACQHNRTFVVLDAKCGWSGAKEQVNSLKSCICKRDDKGRFKCDTDLKACEVGSLKIDDKKTVCH